MSEKAKKLVVSTLCFDPLSSLEMSIPKSVVHSLGHTYCKLCVTARMQDLEVYARIICIRRACAMVS